MRMCLKNKFTFGHKLELPFKQLKRTGSVYYSSVYPKKYFKLNIDEIYVNVDGNNMLT